MSDDKIHVQAFFLADHAEAVKGKLYVTGGCWDRLTVTSLPVVHPHLSVAVSLRVPWTQTNVEHNFRLELRDEDGQLTDLKPLEGSLEVGRPPGTTPGQSLPFVLAIGINNLKLASTGWYDFVLWMDDKQLGRAPLLVQKQKEMTRTG